MIGERNYNLDTEEISRKRDKERKTVALMIEVYCHKKHKTRGDELCADCKKLTDYATERVKHCPYMANKTFCSCCKTPCYKPDMREQIRRVMRFSGPRMILISPRICIKHKLEEIRKR